MNTLSSAIGLLHRKNIQICIIVILTALSYINIFGNSFVWDDEDLIVNWPAIRSFSNIPSAFISPTHPNYLDTYRPIRFVLATATYSLFGDDPTGYHLTTIAIHIAATLLVYFILKRLTSNPYIPFLTALLFGVHPVHTEAITWMSSGLDMMGIVFLLSSLYLFLKLPQAPSAKNASIVFAILAYFSLELTLILPALLVLILWAKNSQKTTISYRQIIPYGLAAGAFLLIRWMFVPTHGEFIYIDGNFFLTALTMARAFIAYVTVLLWPVNLTVNQALGNGISSFMVEITNDFPQALSAIRAQRLSDISVISTLLILLGSTTFAIKVRTHAPLVTLAIGWMLLSLLPVSNIVPIHTLMAERYLYLPSIGFCLLLGITFSHVLQTKSYAKIFGVIIISTLTIWYMTLTTQRNTEWRDNLTLWRTAVARNPQSYIAAAALGKQYLLRNDLPHATQTYENILKIYPTHQALTIFLTNLYIHQGQYEKALRLDPTNSTIHARLKK